MSACATWRWTTRRAARSCGFPELGVGLASIEPLVRKVHLSKVSLESPTLTVRREKTGITNLETLLPKTAPAQKTADQPAAPPGEAVVLDVDEIAVAGATVVFSDLFPRLPFKTTLAPIDVKVTQLSTRPDTKGTYAVTLKTEAKEEIALDGTMSLAPLQVDGKVAVQAVILKKYAPYYSDLVLVRHRKRHAGCSPADTRSRRGRRSWRSWPRKRRCR